LRNPTLSQRDLNFAVQRTIDRIVFLRICEDRRIEVYGRLMALLNGEHTYTRLQRLFREADERYNSGLFHFQKEKDRVEPPDDLTPGLEIDDAVLKKIIRRLYYPESPYEFSVLPADILGQVYEQFLGKVIGLTEGHRAKVEDKPEVKKAGGVYYTPTYIVDYIVKNTVGKLLENKTPKQAVKIRILDPACGSGSFLIGAYQYLLDWHRDWFASHDPKKLATGRNPVLYQAPGGECKLTTTERKRILLQNIFGVDIDAQAVETTKLSLLLKVLEGESEQTLATQLRFYHERALPDLGSNIKCGNSLIEPDFYDQQEIQLLGEEERYRINVFDWRIEFPDIIKSGGFDAVIGNPPYGAYTAQMEAEYLRVKYESPANSLDTFLLFVERAQTLLRNEGLFGMIVPSGWVSAPSAKPLRNLFLRHFQPLSFVSLPFDVFRAYIDTVIVIARNIRDPKKVKDDEVSLVVYPPRFRVTSQTDFGQFEKKANYRGWLGSRNQEFLITSSTTETKLLTKIRSQPPMFGDVLLIKRGIETFNPTSSRSSLVNPQSALASPFQRYDLQRCERGFVAYPPEVEASKPFEYFSVPRILLRQVLSRKLRLQGVLTAETFLTSQSIQSLIPNPSAEALPKLEFLLAVLNSRLISWYFVKVNGVARRDDFPKIVIQQTREMPLPKLVSPFDKTRHDRMVELVKRMLDLHKQVAIAKTAHAKTNIQRQIDATDAQIDELVYELYGLSADEITIVEDGT
jgi:adenine-specific DNA methylase